MTDYIYPEWTTNNGSIPVFPEKGFLEIEYRDGEISSIEVTSRLFKRSQKIWNLQNDYNDIVAYRFVTPINRG